MKGPTCVFKQRTNLVLFSVVFRDEIFICFCCRVTSSKSWQQPATWNLNISWKQKKNCLKSFFASCMKEHDGRMKNFIYWMFYVCTQFFSIFRLLPLLNFNQRSRFFSFFVIFFVLCPSILLLPAAGDEMWGFAVVYLPSRFPRETWRIGKRFNAIWWDYVS